MNEGLVQGVQENFPITDARNIFVLEFLDYFVDPPRYSIDECMQRGLTYSVPLKANCASPVTMKNTSISRPSCRMYSLGIFPT